MVDSQNAEAAAIALRMVVAGLAEQALEAVALPELDATVDRLAALDDLAAIGKDIAVAAAAAAMALRRCNSEQVATGLPT